MFPTRDALRRLHACPPFLMHALALDHNGRRRLPLTVIVQRSGLTERTYLRTARRDNWDDVKLKIIEAMIVGTGVDPMRFAKQRKMLRRHGFKIPHLKPSQQRILDEICAKKVVASESDGLNVPSQR